MTQIPKNKTNEVKKKKTQNLLIHKNYSVKRANIPSTYNFNKN